MENRFYLPFICFVLRRFAFVVFTLQSKFIVKAQLSIKMTPDHSNTSVSVQIDPAGEILICACTAVKDSLAVFAVCCFARCAGAWQRCEAMLAPWFRPNVPPPARPPAASRADNEDRSVQRRLLPSNPAHAAMVATIQEVGFSGAIPGADQASSEVRAKAYFQAIVRKDGALAVQFATALPRQTW